MRLFCLFSNNFHDVTIFFCCYKSRSCSFLVLRQTKKPQKSHLLRNSKIKKMNDSSTNVFWQYQFKWSRQTNSTSNQSMVAPQEFWLLITSLLSLLFFLVVWIFVLVACKLLIKILQDSNSYEDSEANFGTPMERPTALIFGWNFLSPR